LSQGVRLEGQGFVRARLAALQTMTVDDEAETAGGQTTLADIGTMPLGE
jgi:hypothetical protein